MFLHFFFELGFLELRAFMLEIAFLKAVLHDLRFISKMLFQCC